jgi:hypothetical protein
MMAALPGIRRRPRAPVQLRRELSHEPRLADAGLAADQHKTAAAVTGRAATRAQVFEFGRATDERLATESSLKSWCYGTSASMNFPSDWIKRCRSLDASIQPVEMSDAPFLSIRKMTPGASIVA